MNSIFPPFTSLVVKINLHFPHLYKFLSSNFSTITSQSSESSRHCNLPRELLKESFLYRKANRQFLQHQRTAYNIKFKILRKKHSMLKYNSVYMNPTKFGYYFLMKIHQFVKKKEKQTKKLNRQTNRGRLNFKEGES